MPEPQVASLQSPAVPPVLPPDLAEALAELLAQALVEELMESTNPAIREVTDSSGSSPSGYAST